MPVAPNGTPYKICPAWRQPAAMQMPQCGRCGHVYRTQFMPPLNQTQAVQPIYVPHNGQRSKPVQAKSVNAIGVCCALPLLFFLTLFLFSSFSPSSKPTNTETQKITSTLDGGLAYQIRLGMTPDQVFTILGKPDFTNEDIAHQMGREPDHTAHQGVFYVTRQGGQIWIGYYGPTVAAVYLLDNNKQMVYHIASADADK